MNYLIISLLLMSKIIFAMHDINNGHSPQTNYNLKSSKHHGHQNPYSSKGPSGWRLGAQINTDIIFSKNDAEALKYQKLDFSESYIKLSYQSEQNLKAVLKAKFHSYVDRNNHFQSNFEFDRFIDEAFITLQNISGKPIAIVFGKHQVGLKAHASQNIRHYDDLTHHLDHSSGVFGFTFILEPKDLALFDSSEISFYENNSGDLRIGEMNSYAISFHKMITNKLRFSVSFSSSKYKKQITSGSMDHDHPMEPPTIDPIPDPDLDNGLDNGNDNNGGIITDPNDPDYIPLTAMRNNSLHNTVQYQNYREKRMGVGLVYVENAWTFWAQLFVLKDSEAYEYSDYASQVGASYKLNSKSRAVGSFTKVDEYADQYTLGYEYDLTKNLKSGAEIRYTDVKENSKYQMQMNHSKHSHGLIQKDELSFHLNFKYKIDKKFN